MSSQPLSTTMMKVGARLEESRSYLRYAQFQDPLSVQKEKAWTEKWFGFWGEGILDTVVFALYQRFGGEHYFAGVLKEWVAQGLEIHDFKLICHFHTQLSEPFYRWATGVHFYERYQEGFDAVPSLILGKALKSEFGTQKSLSEQSYQRLARGILSTARDFGLLKGKQEKRLEQPLVSVEWLAYVVYALKALDFPLADLPHSPFVRSVHKEAHPLRSLLTEGQNREWWEFHWEQGIFSLVPHFKDMDQWYREGLL